MILVRFRFAEETFCFLRLAKPKSGLVLEAFTKFASRACQRYKLPTGLDLEFVRLPLELSFQFSFSSLCQLSSTDY